MLLESKVLILGCNQRSQVNFPMQLICESAVFVFYVVFQPLHGALASTAARAGQCRRA